GRAQLQAAPPAPDPAPDLRAFLPRPGAQGRGRPEAGRLLASRRTGSRSHPSHRADHRCARETGDATHTGTLAPRGAPPAAGTGTRAAPTSAMREQEQLDKRT